MPYRVRTALSYAFYEEVGDNPKLRSPYVCATRDRDALAFLQCHFSNFDHLPERAETLIRARVSEILTRAPHRFMSEVHELLVKLGARSQEWNEGTDALLLHAHGGQLEMSAAGNTRVYRFRNGRVNTLFAGQTIVAAALRKRLVRDPRALPDHYERIIEFALGLSFFEANSSLTDNIAGPVPLDVSTGDRLLVTVHRTIASMTTTDLERVLALDRERAAQTLVKESRARAKDTFWPFGSAVVIDIKSL